MHFCVAVIMAPDCLSVKDLLLPYKEYDGEYAFPKQFLRFVDITSSAKQEYEEKSKQMVVFADGSLVLPNDKKCYRKISQEQYKRLKSEKAPVFAEYIDGKYQYRIYDLNAVGGTLKNIPYSVLYKTFDDFMYNHTFEHDIKKINNSWGYFENQKARWDNFIIGGRYRNHIETCIDHHVINTNSAKIKDVIFEEDTEEYNAAIRRWEICIEHAKVKSATDKCISVMYKDELENCKLIFNSKQKYAACCANLKTYAVIDPDGKWYEQRQMQYCAPFESNKIAKWHCLKEFVQEFDNECTMTIVDCHI